MAWVERGRQWAGCGCAAALLVALAVPCAARADQREVAAGRVLYQQGDFVGALVRLEQARRSPSLTEDDVVSLHWYTAASHHAMAHPEQVTPNLDAVLQLRPLYNPDPLETPPPLRTLFEQRQNAWQLEHGVTFADPQLRGNLLTVSLAGHVAEVVEVVAHVRAPGDAVFTPHLLVLAGDVASGPVGDLTLWSTLRADHLEAVLEARNRRGTPTSRAGQALGPLLVPITQQDVADAVAALRLPDPVAQPLPDAPWPNATTPAAPAPAPAPPSVAVPEVRPELAPDRPARQHIAADLPYPTLPTLMAGAWAAYGTALGTLAVLAALTGATVFCPLAAPLLVPVAVAGSAAGAVAVWAAEQWVGRWRTPLVWLLASAVGPTLLCSVPTGLLATACWGAGVLFNPVTLGDISNFRVENLWLGYMISILICSAISVPWLTGASVGVLLGAGLTAFLAGELGRSNAAPDSSLEVDLLRVPEDPVGEAPPPPSGSSAAPQPNAPDATAAPPPPAAVPPASQPAPAPASQPEPGPPPF